jgi:hypothetical protein
MYGDLTVKGPRTVGTPARTGMKPTIFNPVQYGIPPILMPFIVVTAMIFRKLGNRPVGDLMH